MAQVRPASVGVSSNVASVDVELARLDTLDLGQLRTDYRNRSGRLAPARISRSLLARVLAYRVQAEQFGDLSPTTRRLLDRLGATNAGEAAGAAAPPVGSSGRLKLGTMLRREWQNRVEQVIVTEGGFNWEGASYASLSAVAFAITGTKWNGYRFFGLPSPHATGAVAKTSGTQRDLKPSQPPVRSPETMRRPLGIEGQP